MNKTGNEMSVPLIPQAKQIINKYVDKSTEANDYVFSILNTDRDLTDPAVLDREISSKNALINKNLKVIQKNAKIKKCFSFHTSRHSYADIARHKGADLYALSRSLGHENMATTERYLKRLGNRVTDNTVKGIFKGL